MVYDLKDGWDLENFSNAYRNWLMEEMDGRGYSILFDILYDIEFEWEIDRDGNRAEDGIYLRADFEYESGLEVPPGWDDWPCSFLEFVAALARKMENKIMYDPDDENDSATWFWELLSNIGLDEFDDRTMLQGGQACMDEVENRVYRAMRRAYSPDGRGGLFPLKHPSRDQRDVEYWFQMNEYCMEKMG